MADSDMPVTVLMLSGGGLWIGALAIYDAIMDCDTEVYVEVLGACMSAAVVIVQACDHRVIHPNATVMVHNGTSGCSETDPMSVAAWGRNAAQELKRMYAMLAKKSTKPAAWWRRKALNGDFIMSAQEAVDLGLFDAVVENRR